MLRRRVLPPRVPQTCVRVDGTCVDDHSSFHIHRIQVPSATYPTCGWTSFMQLVHTSNSTPYVCTYIRCLQYILESIAVYLRDTRWLQQRTSSLWSWACVLVSLHKHSAKRSRVLPAWQVRLLEADNKTEPDTLERWKGERDKAERESAKANVAYVTIREIVKSFQDVPNEEVAEGGEGIAQPSESAAA